MELKLLSVLGLAMIIATVMITELKRIKYSVYMYILNSLLVCGIFLFFAQHEHGIYYWALSTGIAKAVVIPGILLYFIGKMNKNEVKPKLGSFASAGITLIIALTVYSLVYSNIASFVPDAVSSEMSRMNLGIAFAVMAMGIYCLLVKRDVLKIILGLCVMENGVHLSFATFAPTIPESLLLQVLLDVVLVVFILLYFSKGIYKIVGSTDVFDLQNLRG